MKTYAEGLREAARLCEAEILPPTPENVVEFRKPSKESKELHALGGVLKPMLEAVMTMMASKLRRLADEAEK